MTIRSRKNVVLCGGKEILPYRIHYYSTSAITDDVYIGGDRADWLRLVKAGMNATNPLSAYKSFVEFQPMAAVGDLWYPNESVSRGTYGVQGYPEGFFPPFQEASHDSSVLADCVGRFTAKMLERQRPVMAGVFLGELRETIGMIKRTGSRLLRNVGNYVTEAKKLRHRENRSRIVLKKLSELWLEKSFGWTPLFHDVAGAVDALASIHPQFEIVRAWSEKRTVTGNTISTLTLGGIAALQCDEFSRSINVSSAQQVAAVKIALEGAPSPDQVGYFKQQASLWGLTARDFVPTLWELIPYSFLVDYYLNIGDVINATFLDRSSIAWSYQTLRTTKVTEVQWRNIRQLPNYYRVDLYQNVSGSAKVGTKRFTRSAVLTTVPPLTVSYPNFGSQKWTNQAALILARLRTR